MAATATTLTEKMRAALRISSTSEKITEEINDCIAACKMDLQDVGVAVEYANEVYAQLGQEVKARAQAGKLGYDILLNERERLFGFYLYKGNDLTATNTEGNTPCIFSRDFDNVNEQEYTASIENCGNFIYVQGAADDDGSQPVTTVDGEGATGLDLVEVFCDATDIARKYQQHYERTVETAVLGATYVGNSYLANTF